MERETPGNERYKKEKDQESSRGACLRILPKKPGKGVLEGATFQAFPRQKTSGEAAGDPRHNPESMIDTKEQKELSKRDKVDQQRRQGNSCWGGWGLHLANQGKPWEKE